MEAGLNTPVTKPAVTDKAVQSLQLIYNKQRPGSALDKIDVVCVMDYWNTEGTPFIIESKPVLEMSGTEFFSGNASTATSLKTILKDLLIASGEISASDSWS